MSRVTSRVENASARGPLGGFRVVEMNALGPVPFCGMMLADMGAEVVRVTRPGTPSALDQLGADILLRGRTATEADLKSEDDRNALLELVSRADILIEGFRPGIMERHGLGPDPCLARNPRLVYGRMTGWGQTGPLAGRAGHDINYIALSGALAAIGRPGEPPTVPLNLVGDYGGGAMLLLSGVLAALLAAQRSGCGQVVDAAMTDGAALLMSLFYGVQQQGLWQSARGGNLLDGGAPFYRCYRCADGEFVAVGALEPQFFAELLEGLGLPAQSFAQNDRAGWPAMEQRFAEIFFSKTRAQWSAIFDHRDACVTPVLSMSEAPLHPHHVERGTFQHRGRIVQPAPGPRFSQSRGDISNLDHSDLAALVQRWNATTD